MIVVIARWPNCYQTYYAIPEQTPTQKVRAKNIIGKHDL